MRVKNRKCIRRLSFKSLWASRKRNIIAICAIALTTLMFTSLFTIMLSVNSSYETYNFRQAGGYSDGSFKDLSREQADKIAAHKGIKASGERIVCGFSSSDVFGKVAAEVSYMDKNCTKWSYATPTTGKEPQKENEIAMDTTALRLLGKEKDYITREGIFRYMWMNTELTVEHKNFIYDHYPAVWELHCCIKEFRNIFKKRNVPLLYLFIEKYCKSKIKALKSFAEGLKRDIDAVENAVVYDYSNGFVEGTNSRLKMIKRTMYGRCRKRLLEAKLRYVRKCKNG